MLDRESIQTRIRQMRALIQDGRERIAPLRPAWSVHLADETMCRLHEALDALEAEIGLRDSQAPHAAVAGAQGRGESEPGR